MTLVLCSDERKNLLSYAVKLALCIGVKFTIGSGLKRLFHLVYYIQFKSNKKTFEYGGCKYSYFHPYYDTTWYNQRAVEIPIIVEIAER
jgi:hypothetical protein